MYKALITDLDGTVGVIGTDGSDIHPRVRELVKIASARGKKIACATGRGWDLTKPVIDQLGIVDPCIVFGGSCIIDPKSQKVLWEMSLDAEQSRFILDIFKRTVTDRVSVETPDRLKLPAAKVESFTGKNRIIYLLGVDPITANKVIDEVNRNSFAVAHRTTPSWFREMYTDVHVTNPGGTKEHAIQQWQKIVGVTKEETIGLGDSENDVPLFKSVGLKVAVSNAHGDLRSVADRIVPAYNEGGFERTITDILLAS